jgi:mRNA interferase MazF
MTREAGRPRHHRVPGDFGKLRPALVIQSDLFEGTGTVMVLLLPGTLVDAPLIRIVVDPTATDGLRKPSQVMVDKAMTVRRGQDRRGDRPPRRHSDACGYPRSGGVLRDRLTGTVTAPCR